MDVFQINDDDDDDDDDDDLYLLKTVYYYYYKHLNKNFRKLRRQITMLETSSHPSYPSLIALLLESRFL